MREKRKHKRRRWYMKKGKEKRHRNQKEHNKRKKERKKELLELLVQKAHLEHLEFCVAHADVRLRDHKKCIYRPRVDKMSCSTGSPQSGSVHRMIQSVQDWNLFHKWQILYSLFWKNADGHCRLTGIAQYHQLMQQVSKVLATYRPLYIS